MKNLLRKTTFSLVAAFVLMLVAVPARAADVDGKWAGSIDTPMGAIPIAFSFKADGATLTGSQTGMDGMEIPIKNGKIDRNKISFNLSIDFGGMPLDFAYTGTVSADTLQLTADFMGMPFMFSLKKAK